MISAEAETLLRGRRPTRANLDAAADAIIAAGVVPAAMEMMDQACVRAVEASIYAAGYPADAAAVGLLSSLDFQQVEIGHLYRRS